VTRRCRAVHQRLGLYHSLGFSRTNCMNAQRHCVQMMAAVMPMATAMLIKAYSALDSKPGLAPLGIEVVGAMVLSTCANCTASAPGRRAATAPAGERKHSRRRRGICPCLSCRLPWASLFRGLSLSLKNRVRLPHHPGRVCPGLCLHLCPVQLGAS
jgi:hypothetical protein